TVIKRGTSISINCDDEVFNSPAQLEITSLGGQKLYQSRLLEKNSSISLPAEVSPGIYMLVIQHPGGKTVQKIVVE
ncbi:MAG TPA: T9SS type A sorting domain-containing protein, partial [Bacteroidales bacterium]|nr:T9SS type A sorting domain-containing protein [Bacteroidales bacterium]